MKHLYIFMCLIGFTMVSIAQNNIAMLSLAHIEETYIQQGTPIQNDTLISLNYPQTITGLSISGTAILNHSSNSLVRITLQDDYNTEWLVYELFPLLTDSSVVAFDNVAFETSVLDNVTAKWLKVKIINATLQLTDINTSNQAVASCSLQQSRAMEAQSSYIIDKLNENLEKRNIPWRAGETSVSQMTYEEKKAMFGGEVPNLGGFEYYKGGIFVMPGYEVQNGNEEMATASTTSVSEEEDLYVKEWDWRNRHGKNWMTPVKDQAGCGSCWAFAALGTLEAYINLYYNQLLNIDLSEQELVSCAKTDTVPGGIIIGDGCNSGNFYYAESYIREYGIIDEKSFPYTEANGRYNDRPSIFTEQFFISNTTDNRFIYPEDIIPIKKALFNAPLSMSILDWDHMVVLIGFRELKEGDIVCNDVFYKDTLKTGNPLIGKTALVIKNSYGKQWGEEGYGNIVLNENSTIRLNGFTGKLTSMNYNDSNIIASDYDGDGYYFTGISPVTNILTPKYPGGKDYNDGNANYAEMDMYGHLKEIIPQTDSINMFTPSHYKYPYSDYWGFVPNNIVITSSGAFYVYENLRMYENTTIVIESGGRMFVSGSILDQADITIKAGGELKLTNGGIIVLRKGDGINAELGSTITIDEGCSIDVGD